MTFTLAMAQMLVVGGDPARNLERAGALIATAATRGARLVVLPEALDLGWTHPSSRTRAEPIPEGAPCRFLARAAAQHRVHVCAGLTERAGDRVFNAAVLLGPDGSLLATHRKLNELAIGHACYDQGDRLGVVATELGTIGLMICADAFAQDRVLSRSLGYLGADLILSPCAWAVPADHDNGRESYGQLWRDSYQPVAREFALWIVGVSNVGLIDAGPWAGRKCIGCSLAVGPDGEVAAAAPYGPTAETIVCLEVTPRARPARGDAWTDYWRSSGEAGKTG